jgi:hypothetical protein
LTIHVNTIFRNSQVSNHVEMVVDSCCSSSNQVWNWNL